MPRGVEIGHVGARRHPSHRVHRAPFQAAVATDLDPAVVHSGIQQPFHQRGLVERHHVPVGRGEDVAPHGVGAPRPAHHVPLGPVDSAREVVADRNPGVRPVIAPIEAVRAEIEPVAVVGRDDQRRVPVPLQRRVVGLGLRLDVHPLTGAPVEAGDARVLKLGIDDVGIVGVHARLEAVAADHVEPVAVEDAVDARCARRTPERGVVLRPTVNVVEREVVVDPHPVELGDGLVGVELPALAKIPALIDAPVGAHHEVVRIVGVELQVVVVHVLPAAVQVAPGFPVVVADLHPDVHRVDPARAVGVREDLHVVLRIDADVVAALLPALAAIGRAVEAARIVGGGDQRVHDVRVPRRQRQPDPADVVAVGGGEPNGEAAPGGSAVLRLVDAPLGTPGHQEPGVPPALPRGGIDDVRVPRVEQHIADPGVFGNVQHPLPRRSAVRGPVEAAVAPGPPERPLRGDVDGPAVARVDHDLPDVLRFVEAQVLERRPAVAAPPDPVPVTHRALAVVLPGPQPEQVRVLRIDHDRRGRVDRVVLEDGLPGGAPVRGLEGVSGGDGDVPGSPVVRVDRHVSYAAGAGRGSDAPEPEAGQQVFVDRRSLPLLRRTGRWQEKGGDQEGGGDDPGHEEIPQLVSVSTCAAAARAWPSTL